MKNIYIDTELVLPMYTAHPYFSPKCLGKKVCIIRGKMWYIFSRLHFGHHLDGWHCVLVYSLMKVAFLIIYSLHLFNFHNSNSWATPADSNKKLTDEDLEENER